MAMIDEAVTLKSGPLMLELALGTYSLDQGNVETIIHDALTPPFVYELGVMPVVEASGKNHMEDNLKLNKALKATFNTMKTLKDDGRDCKPPKAKSIL